MDFMSYAQAKREAQAYAIAYSCECVVVYSPCGPGFDWTTEIEYRTRLLEVRPEDVCFHTVEGEYYD